MKKWDDKEKWYETMQQIGRDGGPKYKWAAMYFVMGVEVLSSNFYNITRANTNDVGMLTHASNMRDDTRIAAERMHIGKHISEICTDRCKICNQKIDDHYSMILHCTDHLNKFYAKYGEKFMDDEIIAYYRDLMEMEKAFLDEIGYKA